MTKLNFGDTGLRFQLFQKELEGLAPEALLEKQLDFEALPKAEDCERDLRFLQENYLEAALVQAFGFGGWQGPLQALRAARSAP